jgi:hypothetical protein
MQKKFTTYYYFKYKKGRKKKEKKESMCLNEHLVGEHMLGAPFFSLECRGQYSSSIPSSCATLGLYIVRVQNHMHTQQPKQTHTHTNTPPLHAY